MEKPSDVNVIPIKASSTMMIENANARINLTMLMLLTKQKTKYVPPVQRYTQAVVNVSSQTLTLSVPKSI